MTVRTNLKQDRRQISFYPSVDLIKKLDDLTESEGEKSRAYILEMIVEDWFKRMEEETTSSQSIPDAYTPS